MALNVFVWFFLFKQKTAYDLRISDWSSDVCSSDLGKPHQAADKRSVDPDILEIASDGGLQTIGYGACVPTPDRVGNQRHDGSAIIVDRADHCPAGIAVHRTVQAFVGFQRMAQTAPRTRQGAGSRGGGQGPNQPRPAPRGGG